METLIDFLAANFPLNDADKAKIGAFDENGSHIYAAAVVRWFWEYDEESEDYQSIRVTNQLCHPDITLYDDRSEDYQALIDRIDFLEGHYLDRLEDNGLPGIALFLDMCYLQQREDGVRAVMEDIFLVLPSDKYEGHVNM